MAILLTPTEQERVTQSYFIADNGKAIDVFFFTSFWLTHFLKMQKGIFERPDSGDDLKIPIQYRAQAGGWYHKGMPLPSDDVETSQVARFTWKHAWANATTTRIDGLKNAGKRADINLTVLKTTGQQLAMTKTLQESIYDDYTPDATDRLTGILAGCNTSTTIAYAGLLPSQTNGEWVGRRNTTSTAITPKFLRSLRTTAKVRDGKGGRIDLFTMRQNLFDVLVEQLSTQRRYTKSETTAKAGFTGIVLDDDCIVTTDDQVPDTATVVGVNSMYIGFAVHEQGMMKRSPWRFIEGSPEDRTSKMYFDGNIVNSNRKAHIVATAVTETAG